MRRSLVAACAALLLVLVAAGPAGAVGRSRSDGTHAYCGRLVTMLKFLSGSEQSARTPATRRAVVAVIHGAPAKVAKPAGTLGQSLLKLIDHGPKSVHAAEQRRATKAGDTLIVWGTTHCPAVRRKVVERRAASQDLRAQSALRNGLTNAKGIYTDNDSYVAADAAALNEAEPSLHFLDGPTDPTDPTAVSVHVADAAHIVMAAGTGVTCFYIRDDAMAAGTEFAQAPGSACNAATPPAVFTIRWR
jgi:hypothetical protein